MNIIYLDLIAEKLNMRPLPQDELSELYNTIPSEVGAVLGNQVWPSNVNLGRVLTKEHREAIGRGRKGKIHSEETKQKMSKSAKGKANKKGYKLTAEQRERIAAARRGKKFPRN